MATRMAYTCNDCGANFEATTGGTAKGIEFRCEKCDNVIYVPYEESKKSDSITCTICEGEMRRGLEPMCPQCKSRNVKGEDTVGSVD